MKEPKIPARGQPRTAPPTSDDLDSIEAELRYAGDRTEIALTCAEIGEYLRELKLPDHYWGYIEIGRAAKKNFAQRLSTSLAQKIADHLRPRFPGIYPDAEGRGHESRSQGAGGLKKLDVNYSTVQMGLGLAVSIKTINFKDEKTGRYTKNIKRVDGELRAEAQDCHVRQPFAVLGALVLLPIDAALDGIDGRSSLKHAWDVFRRRGGRNSNADDASRFEKVFLGLYETTPDRLGRVRFFSIDVEPPDQGPPDATVSLSEFVALLEETFRARNKP